VSVLHRFSIALPKTDFKCRTLMLDPNYCGLNFYL
jgi:hypothetical protein